MNIHYLTLFSCLLCILFSFSTKPGKVFSALGWICALVSQIIIIGLKGAA